MYDMWWIGAYILLMVVISVFDIRNKTVPLWTMIFLLFISMAFLIYKKDVDWYDFCLSLWPGAFLILVAICAKGKIGIADGIVLSLIGIGVGAEKCTFIFSIALLLNCIVAGILLLLKRVSRNSSIPFMPFITIGMGVTYYVLQ